MTIKPKVNGWLVTYQNEEYVFTEFKELTKFLRANCKALEPDEE